MVMEGLGQQNDYRYDTGRNTHTWWGQEDATGFSTSCLFLPQTDKIKNKKQKTKQTQITHFNNVVLMNRCCPQPFFQPFFISIVYDFREIRIVVLGILTFIYLFIYLHRIIYRKLSVLLSFALQHARKKGPKILSLMRCGHYEISV